jgi:hypothetical protein
LEWVDDSYACLEIAEIILEEVDELIQESIQHDDVIPYLKVKIKNCLENCRSPLDYVANYIFETYCKSEYTRDELNRLNIYFPIRNLKYGKKQFEWVISNNFRNLRSKNPSVVTIFESKQKFNGQLWLSNLSYLINKNKHKNLTKNYKEHVGTINHYVEDQNGNVFSNNIVIGGNPSMGIVVDGHSLTDPSAVNNPYFKNLSATYYYDFLFTDLELPVTSTLKQIIEGVKKTINELEIVMTGE